MKMLIVMAGVALITGCVALITGCGGTSSNGAAPKDEPSMAEGSQAQAATADTTAENPAETEKVNSASIIGPWENSSCADRKYRRQIIFQEGDKFVAVDEVAPCPPNARCVWSGIINWHGTWSLENDLITLEMTPTKSGKPPENPPEQFVVLGENPISIGEKSGETICPYQKRK
ncbi:MAG: hypothetical protein GY854_02825 [Deltaproteobacteria bacterium]|nr:hypothetical protein [Deltaproteobacteria bacterium]